jgi:hydrogenase-4 component B
MEQLGGLIKRMPVTAAMFLAGALSAAALPPLNGFVSEWLLFQALVGGSRIPQPWTALLMPLAVGLLALSAGLAATCFVRAFGVTFLAIPRSTAAEAAVESPRSMQAAMILLALSCLVLGLTPVVVASWLSRIAATQVTIADLPALGTSWSLGGPALMGQASPAGIAATLTAIAVGAAVTLRWAGASRRVRAGDTWGCGRIEQTPRMQYTATAFAEPLRRVFAALYRPAEDVSSDLHPQSKYFIQSMQYSSEMHPWFETLVSRPASGVIRRLTAMARAVQGGSLHLYLLYLSAALLALLILAQWIG